MMQGRRTRESLRCCNERKKHFWDKGEIKKFIVLEHSRLSRNATKEFRSNLPTPCTGLSQRRRGTSSAYARSTLVVLYSITRAVGSMTIATTMTEVGHARMVVEDPR